MGPLQGVRVVEVAGIGPGPFCCMLLADMGAEVLRVDRPETVPERPPPEPPLDLLTRGRRSIAVDLKHPQGAEVILRLVEVADVLVEGFRPGVAERLGIGPDACLARNRRLIYGRMTGWGQEGPYAQAPGHDLNYIALAGVLHHIGRAGEKPVPPLNLVADFGGGGMLLAFGIVCALLEVRRSGMGQVIDAAMVDGAALLMTLFHSLRAMGWWSDARGTNLLDSGAHFYEVYETADGQYVSIACLEPKFYRELLERLGLDPATLPDQFDRQHWPAMKEYLAATFRSRTRDEWERLLAGTEVCFAPVLSLAEAPYHPHNLHRGTFVEVAGVVQPGPAPRFSRTPGAISRPPPYPGEHTREALLDWGFEPAEIERLQAAGAIK